MPNISAKQSVHRMTPYEFNKHKATKFVNVAQQTAVGNLPQNVDLKIVTKEELHLPTTSSEDVTATEKLVKTTLKRANGQAFNTIFPARHFDQIMESTHVVYLGKVKAKNGQMCNSLVFLCVEDYPTTPPPAPIRCAKPGKCEGPGYYCETCGQEGGHDYQHSDPITSYCHLCGNPIQRRRIESDSD